uniref:Uncharacterized protein n=1 Tax=Arundo donax TaxID=35708 RepID=A0A0A8XSH3_ARUDO
MVLKQVMLSKDTTADRCYYVEELISICAVLYSFGTVSM